MSDDTVITLSKYIATQILKQPNRSIGPDQPLLSSGMIDSFNLVDLAGFVEDTYGVVIEDYELTPESFDTLDELAALIEERR